MVDFAIEPSIVYVKKTDCEMGRANDRNRIEEQKKSFRHQFRIRHAHLGVGGNISIFDPDRFWILDFFCCKIRYRCPPSEKQNGTKCRNLV